MGVIGSEGEGIIKKVLLLLERGVGDRFTLRKVRSFIAC